MVSGLTARPAGGCGQEEGADVSSAVIMYRLVFPVLTPAGMLIEQPKTCAVGFHPQVAVLGLILGPARETRTLRDAASDAATLPRIAVPAALVRRNRTLMLCTDFATVVPGRGDRKPPNPYTTVNLAITGAGCLFPARSPAPAQVAVNDPTPC